MNAPKGWEETERAMCELEKMAFAKIMADVSMPDDSGPDYDSWLFHKAWQAAEVHEPQGLRREVQELLPLLLNGIMPNKEALHYLRDLAYAPPSQDDEPSYWLIKDHEKDQPFLVDNKDSLTDHLKVGYRIVAELYTRPSSDELRKAAQEDDAARFDRLREAVEEVWETYDKTDPIQIQGPFFHALATVRQSLKR